MFLQAFYTGKEVTYMLLIGCSLTAVVTFIISVIILHNFYKICLRMGKEEERRLRKEKK